MAADFGDANKVIARVLKMVPDGYLIPAVQNRIDYINILQKYNPRNVLDFGTGSVAIYLVLIEIYYPNIDRYGIEKDESSFNNALRVLNELNFQSMIQLSSNIPLKWYRIIEFIICNPPFYKNQDQIESSNAAKSATTKLQFNGKPFEIICEGGEVQFMKNVINQSLMCIKLRYCSCMFGFKSSSEEIKYYIKYVQQVFGLHATIHHHKIAYKTIRWVLVWSFVLKRSFTEFCTLNESKLELIIKEIEAHGQLDIDASTYSALLSSNTWSRKFKRHPSELKSHFQSAFTISRNDLKNEFIVTGDGLSKSFWRYLCTKLNISAYSKVQYEDI
eukprot:NODE_960_length_2743_cov_0.177005.p1 type:complete len:331 gc:universal NODE_960_length_2743_cov_0.177005:279-1271(+)